MTYWSPEASTAKVRLARISHEVKRGAVGRETEAAVGGCVLPGRARRLPRGSKGDETGRRLASLRENRAAPLRRPDRKSTRLNSSHGYISYAVFCLKKKKKNSNTSDRETQV